MKQAATYISSGSRVKVIKPGPVPVSSVWDDDRQRCSPSVKRRLQTLFFKGDCRITSQVVYIGSESIRERMRKKNLVKVQLRDAAGSSIVITAEADNLRQA